MPTPATPWNPLDKPGSIWVPGEQIPLNGPTNPDEEEE